MFTIRVAFAGLALACCGASLNQAPTQWRKMDAGPFFSGTFRIPVGNIKNAAYKGIAIKLRPDGKATALFDTELLRMAAWWTGGFIELPEVSRDGLDTPNSGSPVGIVKCVTRQGPGWSLAAGFSDPRPRPYGPLPREQAQYQGLHLYGNRVVLSYTIGGVEVLDCPAVEGTGPFEAFSRTLNVGPSASAMTLCAVNQALESTPRFPQPNTIVWDHGADVTIVSLVMPPKGCALVATPAGATHVTLAPHPQRQRIKLLLWQGAASDVPRFLLAHHQSQAALDLARFTDGGPRLWNQPVTRRGVLGTNSAPYVVDVLTAPYDNPWKSYLRFSGHDFFSNGDAAICSISGDVWIVKGLDAKLDAISWTRFATGLFQPLGLKIRTNQVYVLGRDQITRLHDRNANGEADFYENFNNETEIFGTGHSFHTELQADPEGNFYFTTCADPDDKKSEHGGSLLKVSADGRILERVATGFRNPNGMTVGADGRITVADQQGEWVPSSRIDLVQPSGFYGYLPMHHRKIAPTTYDGPLLWLPHYADNSSGGQAWIESDKWGPFTGALVHTSYGACRLFVVLDDMIGGTPQAAAIALPLKFATGIMRARFHPTDGQLYVCGLRGWQTSGTLSGAFYRVRYTGKPAHMPTRFHVGAKGIQIFFSDPLDPVEARNAENYHADQWNYRWSKEYGSKNWSVIHPNQEGEDSLTIKSVAVSDDAKSLLIEIPGLRPVMQLRLRYAIKASDGAPMKHELLSTVHAVGR